MNKRAEKGTAAAARELLLEDQRAIEKADAEYRDTVLKHGATSDKAVKAKTTLDNAKNKYIADQQHAQQLENVNAHPDPVDATTQAEPTTPPPPAVAYPPPAAAPATPGTLGR